MTHSTPACGRITGTTIIAIAVAVVFAVIGMSCAGPHANVFDALVANAPDARDEPRGGQQDGRISPAETVDDAPLGEARAGYPNDPGRDEGDGRRDHGRDEVDHPPPLGRRVAVAFKLVAIEPSTNPDSLECLVDGSPTKGATGAVSSTGPDSSQAGLAHSGSPEARTAIYLRVSTEEQDLAGQERELVDEAARRWMGRIGPLRRKGVGHGEGRAA